MTRTLSRPARKARAPEPKADAASGIRSEARLLEQRVARCAEPARTGLNRASLVFRDFVRQLEKLDGGSPKTPRGARA